MRNKLLKNSLIYIILEAFNKGIPFILLPILTRYFSTEDYGIWSLFVTFVSICAVFIGMGMSGAISVSFFNLKKEGELANYVGNCFIILVITFVASLFIAIILSLLKVLSSLTLQWVIIGVVLSLTKIIHLIYLSILRMDDRSITFGKFQLLLTLTDAIVSVVGIIFLGLGWHYRALVMFFVSIIASIIALKSLVDNGFLNLNYDKKYIRGILRFGIPLLPHQIGLWIRTGADRFIIIAILTSSVLGIYSATYQIGFLLAILVQAFNQAYQPVLYKELSENPDERLKIKIVKRTYLLFLAIIILSCVLMLIMPSLTPIFLGDEYASGSSIISWFVVASGFQGMYLVLVMFILFVKKTEFLSIITIITSIVHLIFSFMLIEKNGILGAAQASVISHFLAFVLTWWLANKVYSLPWLDCFKGYLK